MKTAETIHQFQNGTATLHARGLQALQQNDYQKAMEAFCLCAPYLKEYVHGVSSFPCCRHHCYDSASASANHNRLHLGAFEIANSVIHSEQGDNNNVAAATTTNGTTFFPLVFFIERQPSYTAAVVAGVDYDGTQQQQPDPPPPPHRHRFGSNTCAQCQRNLCLQCAVLHYHVALTHHCEAWQEVGDSQKATRHRQVALGAYQRAMRVLRHTAVYATDGSAWLIVALGNNMAFLQAELLDRIGVEASVEWTLTKFAHAVRAATSTMASITPPPAPFLANALVWQAWTRQSSPAA